MPLPRGRNLRLSLPRRLVCEFMHFSRGIATVAVERRMLLRPLTRARTLLTVRPSWFALFIKGFALVARRREALRRFYRPFPWPHLHQHGCNVATLAVSRRLGDEEGVFLFHVRSPEEMALEEIDAAIRRVKSAPLNSIPDFRRQLFMARLPWPLRRLVFWLGLNTLGDWRARYFGTFLATGVSGLGADSLHVLSPLTTTLTYGTIEASGAVTVRLFFDHRVLDGAEPALALEELEETLCGPIVQELAGLGRRAA